MKFAEAIALGGEDFHDDAIFDRDMSEVEGDAIDAFVVRDIVRDADIFDRHGIEIAVFKGVKDLEAKANVGEQAVEVESGLNVERGIVEKTFAGAGGEAELDAVRIKIDRLVVGVEEMIVAMIGDAVESVELAIDDGSHEIKLTSAGPEAKALDAEGDASVVGVDLRRLRRRSGGREEGKEGE